MSAGDNVNFNAAAREVAPAVIRIERAPERVTRAAEKVDASVEGLWVILEEGFDVGLPDPLLLRCVAGEIDEVPRVDQGRIRSSLLTGS